VGYIPPERHIVYAWMHGCYIAKNLHTEGEQKRKTMYITYVALTNQIAADVMQQWAWWSLVSVSDLLTHF